MIPENNESEKKKLLTYAIAPRFEQEIREYVDQMNRESGISKQMIVTNLLLLAIRGQKKIAQNV